MIRVLIGYLRLGHEIPRPESVEITLEPGTTDFSFETRGDAECARGGSIVEYQVDHDDLSLVVEIFTWNGNVDDLGQDFRKTLRIQPSNLSRTTSDGEGHPGVVADYDVEDWIFPPSAAPKSAAAYIEIPFAGVSGAAFTTDAFKTSVLIVWSINSNDAAADVLMKRIEDDLRSNLAQSKRAAKGRKRTATGEAVTKAMVQAFADEWHTKNPGRQKGLMKAIWGEYGLTSKTAHIYLNRKE